MASKWHTIEEHLRENATATPFVDSSSSPQPVHEPYAHHSAHQKLAPSTQTRIITAHQSDSRDVAGNAALDELDTRPVKRLKLSVRERKASGSTKSSNHDVNSTNNTPTQTTLDRYRIAAPPAKIARVEPHGAIVETVNGVSRVLDLSEDELLKPTPMPHTRALRRSNTPLSQPGSVPQKGPQKKQEEKRTLRSQDEGPRLKSELATYFSNYEEIMFEAPREEDFLTVNSALYVTEDVQKPAINQTSPAKGNRTNRTASNPINGRRTSANGAVLPPLTPQRASSSTFNGSPSLNLEMISRTISDNPEDPLTDAHFFKSHRRAERREKQLRNIERERAMHEKVQLDRLLDGLQGHDWLKVLGLTGITDGEAKRYERQRQYFIEEVQSLVDKFKQWKDQERKLRLEKEEAAAAAREAEDEDEGEASSDAEGSIDPPSSDLNASAARQLQQETANALRAAKFSAQKLKAKLEAKRNSRGPSTPASASTTTSKHFVLPPPIAPPSPEMPITSFYAKRHLRDAALGKARHGRSVTAFGHPVPELPEDEFALPEDYITEDFLKANARERRRRKRESAVNATGS